MNIHKQLAAIQTALKAPKSQFNSFGNYHYRKAEDILEAVKPLLKEQGCTLICTDDLVLIGDRYYVKATAQLTNEEGQIIQTSAYAREEETKKGMDGSQVTGASSSYARKYALNGLFCIDDTQDSDTTNVGEQNTPTKPTKPAKKAPQPAAASAPAPAAEAPAQTKPLGIKERWIKALATNAVNEQGVSAQDAYFQKFNPTPEEWQLVLDEVYHYKKDHNIQ